MPSTIQVTVFEDAEAWLRKNLPDMQVDSVACVYPLTRFYPDGSTPYVDREELTEEEYARLDDHEDLGPLYRNGKIKQANMADHIRALQLLCEKVGDTLFVGGCNGPKDLVDPGNWDIEVTDAYFQLVFYGKVIYG